MSAADRSAWDRAFLAYEKAKAEDEAFNAIFDPLYDEYEEAVDAVPHAVLRPDPHTGRWQPVSTADRDFVRQARRTVQHVAAGKCRFDPIPELQEHYALCQEVAAAAEKRDAQIKAIGDRLGYDDAEERWAALGEALVMRNGLS